MNRAGNNTLFCEINGLSEGLAMCEWVASWIGLAKSLDYDLRKRGILNREIRVTAIMNEPEGDLSVAAITDAKSLYDTLSQEQYTGADKRSAHRNLRDQGQPRTARRSSTMGTPRRKSNRLFIQV